MRVEEAISAEDGTRNCNINAYLRRKQKREIKREVDRTTLVYDIFKTTEMVRKVSLSAHIG